MSVKQLISQILYIFMIGKESLIIEITGTIVSGIGHTEIDRFVVRTSVRFHSADINHFC